jgi:hypothetical protein
MLSGFKSMCRLLALLFLGGVAQAAEVPLAARKLFNGTNLAGFTTWLVDMRHADPRQVFTVTNGMLRISGDGLGYLATTNEYHDYFVEVDFKWGATNSDWGARGGTARGSGLFLHASGPQGQSVDGRGAFMAAIECNLFEGATGDFLLIRGTNAQGMPVHPRISYSASTRQDADGFRWFDPNRERRALERWGRVNWIHKSEVWRDEFGFRGERDVETRAGEWNRLRVTCQGSRIRVESNGVLVNEAFDVFPHAGRILLQCEGSEIFFRRLELRPVPPASP